jgi:hypothetical protein
MSYFEQTKITDSNDVVINPATEESILLLRRMVKLLESNAVVDINMRQKVFVAGAYPATNTPTGFAPAINAGPQYWLPVWVGPVDQRFQVIDAARNTYANSIRNNLTFS